MKKLLILLLLTQLAACMSFSDRPFRDTRDSIVEQLPDITLEKEFAMSMGSSMLGILNVMAMDSGELADLDRVELAVYNVRTTVKPVDFSELDLGRALRSRGSHLHWETVVRVRDKGEQVWVLVGMNTKRNSLEAVSVFVLEEDELVLINVDGDLNRMIEFALRPASERRGEARAS